MRQPSETLLVTAVQSNLFWEDKQSNLRMLENTLENAGGRMEVVLLPEMFNTGFTMRAADLAESMDGETVNWMKRIAREKKVIIAGSLIIAESGNYYNRMIWMQPDGKSGHYDKRHLFAYAGEDESFTPGRKRLVTSVKGWKLNLQVCYDLRFPVWARQSVPVTMLPEGTFAKTEDDNDLQPEYDVLVYVANWPERRIHAWKTLLQARAIENQCYVVGVNRIGEDGKGIHYSGDSMVVDPMGEIIETAGSAGKVFTCTLQLNTLTAVREKLPFLRDADPFLIGN